jgi:tetratricopeptide (TPR) repeat protein
MRIIIFLLIILSHNLLFSVNIDSLLLVYENGNQKDKLNTLWEIGEYYSDKDYDTSLYYLNTLFQHKDEITKKLMLKLNISYGEVYINLGEYDKSFSFLNKALELNKKVSDTSSYASINNYIGILYKMQGQYDTALYYYEKASYYYHQIGDNDGEGYLYINIGNINNALSNYDDASKFYQKAIKLGKELSNNIFLYSAYNGLGVIEYKKGDYYKAIKYFRSSVKVNKVDSNYRGMSMCFNNIGMIHYELGNYKTSVNYYNEALKIFNQLGDKIGISGTYSNIGIVYNENKEYKKAKEFYDKALKIVLELGNKREISNIYSNLGGVYLNTKEIMQSKYYLEKALKIKIDIDEKEGISSIYISLSNVYNKLGDSLNEPRYYRMAIYNAKNGLEIAEEINTIPNKKVAYESLYNSYYKLSDLENAYYYINLFMNAKDSLYNEKKMIELQNIEAKYENVKKEQELEKNKILIAKKEAEAAKQNIFIYALIIGFLLAIVVLILFLINIRNKKKANRILSEQKNEISEKNTELNQRNEEILTQRDEIEVQKSQLESIHFSLTESIDYAKNIQSSILSNTILLKDNFTDSFVSFIPKDVVSGDFYWWTKINDTIIVAAVDCTGHGVPGAFMSMLGVTLLNEIVIKEQNIQPNIILNKLRQDVIKSLNQDKSNDNQKDGMDISLVSINIKTNEIQFAGANNPLYIIKNEKLKIENDTIKLYKVDELSNLKLYEVKADKMPIAIYEKMNDFSTKKIQLEKGDTIYLFSDGFADQFGGEKGKRITTKRFKNLILSNSNKKMNEQKQDLENFFNQWKNESAQIDDILVIGIKI